jgi:hypothetical protein
MLSYKKLKDNRRQFLALTGLTVREFKELLGAFGEAYETRYPETETLSGQSRQRRKGGGRKSNLDRMEDKLLFILVYQKTYPLQAVQGELFEMSQSRANEWIQRLLPVLQSALGRLGVKPERDGLQLAEQEHTGSSEWLIDGTEHRRQRPKQAKKQTLHYSGKKKAHSDKNLVVAERSRKRVVYLSQTYPGKVHDKKIADQEQITYPANTTLYQDTGFQGYAPNVSQTRQPKKSRVDAN